MQTLKKDECNYLDVARFIGIFSVVLAHFMFAHMYLFIPVMIYSFHMPLFFFISGILHKKTLFSTSALWSLFRSLIIPFWVYNLICLSFFLFVGNNSPEKTLDEFVKILILDNFISAPTWFFLSLFWVKLISFCIRPKIIFGVVGLLCITLMYILDTFLPASDFHNRFMLHTSLMAFPFFASGFLLKKLLDVNMHVSIKLGFIILTIGFTYYISTYYGGSDLSAIQYVSLPLLYIVGIFNSVSVIFLSQLLIGYIKCNLIKDMSRGTMVIVGFHFFVMYQVFPSIFFGVKPLREILFLSIILFLSFYPIIKLTYNRIPILYGKKYKKLCKP